MLKGIYTPLSGALAQERVVEVLSNNLANVNTTGFKGDKVSFTILEPEPFKNYKDPLPPANYKINMDDYIYKLKGNEISYVGVNQVERDLTQGPAIKTGNKTDVMLEGNGYIRVMTDSGTRYTRDGSLHLGKDGALLTADGHAVQGERGSIFLRSGQFEINRLGEIFQDGELVDRLLIEEFSEPTALERVGQNLLLFNGDDKDKKLATNTGIRQGFLEGSNVNAIKSMTDLIVAHRSFEAYQKAIKDFDSMMDKSSNTIGQVQA